MTRLRVEAAKVSTAFKPVLFVLYFYHAIFLVMIIVLLSVCHMNLLLILSAFDLHLISMSIKVCEVVEDDNRTIIYYTLIDYR
jgi:hypothetical protein